MMSATLGGFAPETPADRWAQREAIEALVTMLGPMMPHLAEEIWQGLGHGGMLADAPWPQADPALLKEDTVTIAVQVKGKLRDTMLVPRDSSDDAVREAALGLDKIQKALAGSEVRKVIVVQNRIVNIVV